MVYKIKLKIKGVPKFNMPNKKFVKKTDALAFVKKMRKDKELKHIKSIEIIKRLK